MTFSISTSGWPTSGAASAGTTGFATVGANWSHGSDADGNYIEHNGDPATTDVVNPIAEATVASFLNGAGNQVYRHTLGVKITGGDGSAAAREFNRMLFWFSSWSLYLRHVTSDGRVNADGTVNAVRIYGTGGTTIERNKTGYLFVPTNTLVRLTVEVEETTASSVFTIRAYLNGELISYAEGIAISTTNAARVVEPRSIQTGTASQDCKLRLYGDFVGEQDPSALRPSSASQTSSGYRALPVAIDDGFGWWNHAGTVTLSDDIDDLNGGTGSPPIPIRSVEIGSGGSVTTVAELGTLVTNDAGSGAIIFPAFVINDGTARSTISILAPGGASTLLSIRFDTDGNVKAAAGSGALLYTGLTDQDGAAVTWTAGDVYELAVHFAPGQKPSLVVHTRSETFAGAGAVQTMTAASIAAAAVGVPAGLGTLSVVGAGTGSANFFGIWLAASHWFGMSSSWVHWTDSPFGGATHVLEPAVRRGFGLSWGNEVPGLEPAGDRPNELSALGRSGGDLADWESVNPAWDDLLPLLPAARFFWADTMVNHLLAQRTNGTAAINTARDEVLAQVGRFIDAAKANGVRADFMSQWPMPTGGPLSLPADIGTAAAAINAGIRSLLEAAGRRDLFTWADVIDGRIEGDFFTAATDDAHYNTSGDEIAFDDSYTLREPIGNLAVAGMPDVRRRRRA